MAYEMYFLYYSSKDYTVVTRSQGFVCKRKNVRITWRWKCPFQFKYSQFSNGKFHIRSKFCLAKNKVLWRNMTIC
jgi:hypothetical protein